MPYVERKGGVIVGVYANIQPGQAEEWLPDDASEVVAFLDPEPNLYEYAAQRRWEKEVGGVEVGGITVMTDDRSKTLIAGARMGADNDPSFTAQFKPAGGSFMEIDAVTIAAISDAVLAHTQACFAIEASVVSSIDAGTITSTAEIDAAFA